MTDTHLDEALRLLEAELAVRPSPEFAAKVRVRIAADPAPHRVPRWAMWSALAFATAGTIIVATTIGTTTSQQTSSPVVATTAVTPPVVAERLLEAVPLPAGSASPGRKRAAAKPVKTASAAGAAEIPRATTPVFEVITNQPTLIREAFERAMALQRELPVREVTTVDPLEPLTLSKVVIEPIVIPRGAALPPSGAASPVIRRVSASEATRSPR